MSTGTIQVGNPKCGVCGNYHSVFTPCPDVGKMVDRFLSWKLPRDFSPDCGIHFDGRADDALNVNKTWPVGTNLFTADQARQMIEHLLKG